MHANQLRLKKVLRSRVARAVKYQSVASQQKGNVVDIKHKDEDLEDVFSSRVIGIFIEDRPVIAAVSVKNGLRVPLLTEEEKGKSDVEAKSKRKGTRKSKWTEEMSVEKGSKRV
ncbi:hypothetical protein K435DRAFT_805773 [Dendrothele bispora CBS 962.96]|uniref:Uncharacterized protein n=1 Tax=Dendrothele bispora (strain CBS 962.96) TaxID=1314807 RepID=A0A4S8L9X7_DENBC|nr:hypothetical protein K435DRAFT_805773 [Dendrothele bispora CBS 962.96]